MKLGLLDDSAGVDWFLLLNQTKIQSTAHQLIGASVQTHLISSLLKTQITDKSVQRMTIKHLKLVSNFKKGVKFMGGKKNINGEKTCRLHAS